MSFRCWFYILLGALRLHSCGDCPNRHWGCPWASGSCLCSLGEFMGNILSFLSSSREKASCFGLLQHCVQMTDPLYRILMTCALFFRPFTPPCYCWSYLSRYSASYTRLTHLTRKRTTKTVQPTKHATADKRTIAPSTVTALNLQSFIKPPSHGTTITPLKHTLDSQKPTSKQDAEIISHHSATPSTKTPPILGNTSGHSRTTTLTIYLMARLII